MAPRLGVFGGSGFYEFLDDAVEHVVDTPYGPPAAPVVVGSIAGHEVAFMARHGVRHDYQPHRVPYRANVWAMHSIGVRSVIAPCSVGSLQPDIHPEQLVVVDQLVDRTWGRPDTFHDTDEHPPPDLRRAVRQAAGGARHGCPPRRCRRPRRRDDGRDQRAALSTVAESRWFRAMGWHVVNMTGYPEAVLAAEIGRLPAAPSSPTTTPVSTGTNR